MTWATLGNINLDPPSSFVVGRIVIGGYNVTLTGTKRRYIKAIKKQWVFGYDILSLDQYNNIMAAYNTLIPAGIQTSQPYLLFTILNNSFSVSNEQVHMDISDAQFIPGTDLYSSITITLTQL